MKETSRDKLLNTLVLWGLAGIMVVAPFYAPITVILAGKLQHFDLLRIWKEIVLTAVGCVVLYFIAQHFSLAKRALKATLFKLIFLYAGLLVGISIYDLVSHRVSPPAVIYGLMIDLRTVGFFTVMFLAVKIARLQRRFEWWKIVLIPAAFVVGFAVLQITVLPDDVLKHIGYSKQTITPYQLVDNNPEYVRIQSTLRGPNPLGAYLVLIISLVLVYVVKGSNTKSRKYLLLFLTASLVAMFGTYSRSAFVGMILAISVLILVSLRNVILQHKRIAIGAFVVLLAVGGGISATVLKNNSTVETVISHSTPDSLSPESSNSQRQGALVRAAKDVKNHPLGQGVGSAGPASLRNKKGPGKIAENYYLQLGQEIGILGMSLFIAINVAIAYRLFLARENNLCLALLASFVGISFINLVSHAWADDTLAYVWWGLAGYALASPNPKNSAILNKIRKRDGKEKTNQSTAR